MLLCQQIHFRVLGLTHRALHNLSCDYLIDCSSCFSLNVMPPGSGDRNFLFTRTIDLGARLTFWSFSFSIWDNSHSSPWGTSLFSKDPDIWLWHIYLVLAHQSWWHFSLKIKMQISSGLQKTLLNLYISIPTKYSSFLPVLFLYIPSV